MPDDLTDAITESAAGPKSAASDGVSVTSHSLPDQIAADRYLASKRAAAARVPGIRLGKIIPPGAV